MTKIKYIKIHPAIGIARVGNAVSTQAPASDRDDFFIGPLVPGPVLPPTGGYKKDGRVKSQAAQFRLFSYDHNDELIGEITEEQAVIEWSVTLANTKAGWLQFNGLTPGPPRNPHILDKEQRQKLNVTPASKSLTGAAQGPAYFDDGTFSDVEAGTEKTVPVPLGEIFTDETGHLLVLAANGKSGSPFNTSIDHYANNPGWHDDLADGPVDAKVTLKSSGQEVQVIGSWVVCTLPKYSPDLENFLTLYDTLYDVAVLRKQLPAPKTTEFYQDIVPFLRRLLQVRWTMGVGPAHDFLIQQAMQPEASSEVRHAVFDRLRSPKGSNVGLMNMPVLYDDNNNWQRSGNAGLAITTVQYDHLQRWAEGCYTVGEKPSEIEQDIPVTPDGMDRAALEACCGGAFFPGMEVSWAMRDVYVYSEPFRLSRLQPSSKTGQMEPGDAVKQMAVPWQADFLECRKNDGETLSPGWWPQQRPDMVIPFGDAVPVLWQRGIKENDHLGMVLNWSKLGFVLYRDGGYYEAERTPFVTDAPEEEALA